MMSTTTLHNLKLKINFYMDKQKWQIALWSSFNQIDSLEENWTKI
jgi:hypothetical protein